MKRSTFGNDDLIWRETRWKAWAKHFILIILDIEFVPISWKAFVFISFQELLKKIPVPFSALTIYGAVYITSLKASSLLKFSSIIFRGSSTAIVKKFSFYRTATFFKKTFLEVSPSMLRMQCYVLSFWILHCNVSSFWATCILLRIRTNFSSFQTGILA